MSLKLTYNEVDPKALTKEEVREVQRFRLRSLIKRVYENSPYYHKLFKERGLTPDDIKAPEDLVKLPFTYKDDLRRHAYPHGGDFLAVPFENLVGWHMTSGTTGIPTVNAYTWSDVEVWSNLVARSLVAAGVTKNDIVMNIYGYGLFTGGIGLHQGIQRIGAKVMPWSTGRTEALARALKDFKTTVITGTPSYELLVAETLRKLNIDAEKELQLRLAIPGAEAMTKEMLERIEDELSLKTRGGRALEIYGLTEALGPGVAQECPDDNHEWLHIWTDHYLVEIIDPETGERVSEDKEGEMVITTLSKEAMPLIRYRTRDITSLIESDDEIPFPKIRMLKGRLDDVIFYKGVKLFPTAIANVLMSYEEVKEFQIVVDKTNRENRLIIKVETEKPSEKLVEKLIEEIRTVAFVTPEVEFVSLGTLPRFEGKSKRVVIKE
ncbi:Phenylacetate--CoA ligase [Sulfolobus islandicus Y.N.15.51]|jgi:phenylacetate-CoA ligase|uniref:Phenylacetate--CoA ligase n=1 Tax=Saccharolobus islandicus (strain Y.N.15.51 / Yellowstone \|nr:phenylacetate--CoA ligase family protein [Sulfolobus islandicus]ACP49935.1 Phenylacetate--CoA ligase [Sulfolobus islandicus Y.N.15.51]